MSDANDPSALARRDFLKATGAVVVGVGVAARVSVAQAPAGGATVAQRGVVSGPPDPAQIDSYIAIHPDNTATLFAGYVELGQGGPTALRQVAAEELDLDLDQVKDVRADTFVSTNGFTAASRTAGIGGTEVRAAAAEARRVLVTLASERLKAPASDLVVAKGVVSVRSNAQRSVTYAELLGARPFNRAFEQVSYQGGIELPRKGVDNAPPKRRDAYRIVGTPAPRPDVAENQGHVPVRPARASARHAARPRHLASRAGRAHRQQSNRRRGRRRVHPRHSRSADRPATQFRGRGGAA